MVQEAIRDAATVPTDTVALALPMLIPDPVVASVPSQVAAWDPNLSDASSANARHFFFVNVDRIGLTRGVWLAIVSETDCYRVKSAKYSGESGVRRSTANVASFLH